MKAARARAGSRMERGRRVPAPCPADAGRERSVSAAELRSAQYRHGVCADRAEQRRGPVTGAAARAALDRSHGNRAVWPGRRRVSRSGSRGKAVWIPKQLVARRISGSGEQGCAGSGRAVGGGTRVDLKNNHKTGSDVVGATPARCERWRFPSRMGRARTSRCRTVADRVANSGGDGRGGPHGRSSTTILSTRPRRGALDALANAACVPGRDGCRLDVQRSAIRRSRPDGRGGRG